MEIINNPETAGSLSANRVDIRARTIAAAEIRWQQGSIVTIAETGAENPALPYLLPGFVDAHVHIESSMLTPCEFARMAVRHGTVAAVADPHEIANVLGLAGVQFMLDNARQTPFQFCFGAPSCVPATAFETAGAELGPAALELLLQKPEIRYLAEVMNYPGVLHGDALVMAKLALARRNGCPIDGHAPGLRGAEARRYADTGISTEHECCSLAEAEDKLAAGMHVLIREGSAARNFEALHPLISRYPARIMFCSDDKHPDDLRAGHINQLVARAVAKGHDVFQVLQCACLNPARHYRMPLGLLNTHERMDAVLVDNLRDFNVLQTWIGGSLVAEGGQSRLPKVKPATPNNFQARELVAGTIRMCHHGGAVRVIKARDGELSTGEVILEPRVEQGAVVADIERDILLLTIVNRYRPQPPAVALVQGFGLRRGALASSIAHDSHNIIAVGVDADSICRAVNAVISRRGGIAAVADQQFDILPLPVAGLMSDGDGDSVADHYAHLNRIAKHMGSCLRAPFMTLSFMALLVVPELKLSDKGLFDGRRFQFVDVAV